MARRTVPSAFPQPYVSRSTLASRYLKQPTSGVRSLAESTTTAQLGAQRTAAEASTIQGQFAKEELLQRKRFVNDLASQIEKELRSQRIRAGKSLKGTRAAAQMAALRALATGQVPGFGQPAPGSSSVAPATYTPDGVRSLAQNMVGTARPEPGSNPRAERPYQFPGGGDLGDPSYLMAMKLRGRLPSSIQSQMKAAGIDPATATLRDFETFLGGPDEPRAPASESFVPVEPPAGGREATPKPVAPSRGGELSADGMPSPERMHELRMADVAAGKLVPTNEEQATAYITGRIGGLRRQRDKMVQQATARVESYEKNARLKPYIAAGVELAGARGQTEDLLGGGGTSPDDKVREIWLKAGRPGTLQDFRTKAKRYYTDYTEAVGVVDEEADFQVSGGRDEFYGINFTDASQYYERLGRVSQFVNINGTPYNFMVTPDGKWYPYRVRDGKFEVPVEFNMRLLESWRSTKTPTERATEALKKKMEKARTAPSSMRPTLIGAGG